MVLRVPSWCVTQCTPVSKIMISIPLTTTHTLPQTAVR
jgi:hypothetical protein